jgi:5'-3' exonuclease
MGIPAFFRHLLRVVPALTNATRSGAAPPVDVLAIDFNAMVYACLRRVSRHRPYRGEADRAAFEAALVSDAIAYVEQVREHVGPTELLYVAVDGVAPMAKIAQQRRRRFKAQWFAEQERLAKATYGAADVAAQAAANAPRWDTNAITPGTEFHARLSTALRSWAAQCNGAARARSPSPTDGGAEPVPPTKARGRKAAAPAPAQPRLHVEVSPADEPGEGEQKLCARLRRRWLAQGLVSRVAARRDEIVVYGLDADLIVLSLWHAVDQPGARFSVFREDTEKDGSVRVDGSGVELFTYLDVDTLAAFLWDTHGPRAVAPAPAAAAATALAPRGTRAATLPHWMTAAPSAAAPRPPAAPVDAEGRARFLRDFVGAASLLGNDFVAHAIGLKIRDDGIEKLLATMRLAVPAGAHLLRLGADGTWEYDAAVLARVLAALAAAEDDAVLHAAKEKLRYGGKRPPPRGDRGPEAVDAAMSALNDAPLRWAAEAVLLGPQTGGPAALRADWRAVYYADFLWGADRAAAARAYLASLHWTLRYYQGAPVDAAWYFPWLLPPLWADAAAEAERQVTAPAPPPVPRPDAAPITAVEQLVMVQPRESWRLLPPALAGLPDRAPHLWPSSFGFYSAGRRFHWECPPLVPLVEPAVARALVADAR